MNSSIYSFDPENASLASNSTDVIDKFLILDMYLSEYIKSIHEIGSENLFTGQNCTTESRWEFYSALLFTMSTMSTVGYGNVWPITWVYI